MSAAGWDERTWVDPTAGVRLMPRLALCPRCGLAKGPTRSVRAGLCVDCRAVLALGERAAWAR